VVNTIPLKMEAVSCPLCGVEDATSVAEGIDFEYHTAPDTFTMVQCNVCSLIRLNPRPAIEELDRIYPPEYIPYAFEKQLSRWTNMGRNFFLRGRVRTVAQLAGENAAILDVGCGNGGLLLLLKQFGNPGWQLAGNDITDRPRERLTAADIVFYGGRFEELTARHGEWDIIIMKDVIEHLDAPGVMMTRAFEMLRPGGHLLMETPDTRGWDAKWFFKRYWGGWHFPRHWTIYDSDTMTRHLQQIGYDQIAIKPTLSPNFWAQSIHHWWSETRRLSGAAEWFSAKNLLPMLFFTGVDVIQTTLTSKSSNMQVVARKPL
jgi:2-polyprenyl-3-methyl-5-hydroxy-6-metoxy-1,4-benzoquinol methylase